VHFDAVLKQPQLLELFEALEMAGRPVDEAQQSLAPKHVKADVLQVLMALKPIAVGGAIAAKGNRRTGKI
jgi:hypothetical protein